MAADALPEDTVVLRLPGHKENLIPINADSIRVEPKVRVRLNAVRAEGFVEIHGVRRNDVAALEFSNGFRLWTRVDDLYREQAAKSSRGMARFDAAIWDIDPQVRTTAERGGVGLAIEALEIFGVDVAEQPAKQLAEAYEKNRNPQLKVQYEDALYHLSLSQPLSPTLERVAGELPLQDKPFLIFIHGTGSSLQGGFGKLWAEDSTVGREARAAMTKEYADTAYAFEHRSLTVSPIDNALALAKQLPSKAKLHLVSHSRGGLVGELLCLAQRDRTNDPFNQKFLDAVFKKAANLTAVLGEAPAPNADSAREQFEALLQELDRKQFEITRFVRVACPARGTSLASGRLDRWLSVLEYLSSLGGLVVEGAVDFLLAVVKKRTDPRTLPGLEAMMPGSALTALLNYPGVRVDADLTVIAGDCAGDSIWSRLKLLIADWFYDGDHDLVVNTGSMYGGARRNADQGRFACDQGNDVNHFHYFTNPKTVKLLWEGLSLPGKTSGKFAPLDTAPVTEPARAADIRDAVARSASKGPRPVVFVLPGTMGTELRLGSDRIWLNYFQLAVGSLLRLNVEAKGVESGDLLADYYGDLLEYLARSHEVVPFGYDWRLSIEKSADLFATKVAEKLRECEANEQPLRIIAHSMGGLVARMTIARQPNLWKRMCALPGGSRLIMLGTPNYGSFEAVRWLTGWNPTLIKLTLLDVTHNIGEIVNLVRGYPGLLELLPSNSKALNFTHPSVWQQLCGSLADWRIPLAADLEKVGRTWSRLSDRDIDPDHMIYVAGCAPETISDVVLAGDRNIFIGARPKVTFKATWQGDGTVPWALGRLPGVTTWYVADTAHDALPKASAAFHAFLDLLQTGTTTQLPKEPPRPRAAVADEWEYIPRLPDKIPNEQDLSSFVLGISSPSGAQRQRRPSKINVSISHGNLAYARHPVCVGHYRGDTIVSAEAELDRRLNGVMSDWLRLGIYPGEKGSFATFINPKRDEKPGGAIILGLGQVGELSPGSLETTIKRAMLEYAMKVARWHDDRFNLADTPRSAAVTCLLIGTGAGGLTVRDSLTALLHGIRDANERLAGTEFEYKVLINQVEFLELHEDIAIQAARELAIILTDGRLADGFDWQERRVRSAPGGMRRIMFDERADSWWQRLEVTYNSAYDTLSFIALTGRARTDATTAMGQLRLADAFIREAIATTSNEPDLSKTLFEMLIPNQLKERAPENHNLVILVDETSARYPWELMEDRWSVNGIPPAVAAGMLRQFKTNRSRPVVTHGTEKIAYVVGNPKLPPTTRPGAPRFVDLPGAVKEANAVADGLCAYGYQVEAQVNTDAKDILIGLHSRAYRILHLAGHGVHDMASSNEVIAPNPDYSETSHLHDGKISGMVIGDGVYLTPGDVDQMRWVPELVFINCCYLGSMETAEPERRQLGNLAANLACQFIRMGVKAVIAAGWAVNDAAAEHFAQAFYRHLLGGDAYGEAVRAAREDIYLRFPSINTWGAYQCYGDPSFRLDGKTGATDRNGQPLQPYVLPSELVVALENLLRDVEVTATPADWDKPLQALLDPKRFPPGSEEKWLKRADVNDVLATLYGELGRYEQAITHLDRALMDDNARLSVKTLEQRANYKTKCALEHWLALPLHAKNDSEKDALKNQKAVLQKEVDEAIKDLQMLCGLVQPKAEDQPEGQTAPSAATVERLCLIGSAFKRLAWMQTGIEATRKALGNMASSYEKAFMPAVAAKDGKFNVYPLANWVTAQSLRALAKDKDFDPKEWWAKQSANILKWGWQVFSDAQRKENEDPDYWNTVIQGDCLLFLYLAYNAFPGTEHDRIERKQVIDLYQRAFRRGTTPRNRAIVIEHLDFLLAMMARIGSDAKPLAVDLKAIRDEVQ